MAEFLVRAQSSTNPSASQVGDIIIVRPDGHVWGKAECLPEYVVIKMPGVGIDDVKHYESQLTKEVEREEFGIKRTEHEIVKRRKYKLPLKTIQAAVTLGRNTVSLSKKEENDNLLNSIMEKTL